MLIQMTNNVSWQEQALCRNMPTENFFDEYEKDEVVREQVKSICDFLVGCEFIAFCMRVKHSLTGSGVGIT